MKREDLCKIFTLVIARGVIDDVISVFQIGAFGEYFLRRGQGRKLEREEAHHLVERYAHLGLVFTTENTKDRNRFIICCCCECCCALLRRMTRFEKKNEACSAKANYIAMVSPELCKGCSLCVERCKFHAITVENKKSSVNPERCYGCGVCAVTCPKGAVKLHRIERSGMYVDAIELTIAIYRENKGPKDREQQSAHISKKYRL